MARILIYPITRPDDRRVVYVGEHMRDEDAREILTATAREPVEALAFAVEVSHRCFVAMSERSPQMWVPVALFGVSHSNTPDHGVCWFLSTPLELGEMKIIRRDTPAWLAVLGSGYKVLHNLLDKRNEKQFRWCLDAGLNFGGEQDINGFPFLYITRPTGEAA